MPQVTTYRLFGDSAVETEVLWYPALPGAPVLDVPSMVLSPRLEPDGIEWPPGGWVQRSPVEYDNVRPNPLALGTHRCGTPTDFREGGQYLPLEPPVTYRTDGLPTCCGAGVRGRGGVAVGGRSVVTITAPVTPGASCAAAVTLAFEQSYTIQFPGAGTFWLRWVGVTFVESIYATGTLLTGAFAGTVGSVSGTDCAHLFGNGVSPWNANTVKQVIASTGDLWLSMFSAHAQSVTVKQTRTAP